MSIESSIFERYSPDFEKCEKFGFKDNKFKQFFLEDTFRADVEITSDGKVVGKVYDVENDDVFSLIRLEGELGTFVGTIKTEYEKILVNIRDKCFIKNYFIYSQSNRITNLMLKKYGDEPEFLWEKFQGSGIFRNKQTRKWYAAILDVNKCKLKPDTNEIVEVINVKLDPIEIQELLKLPEYYPAYHMNKKNWITIILDDSLDDRTIMHYVEKSYKHCISRHNV